MRTFICTVAVVVTALLSGDALARPPSRAHAQTSSDAAMLKGSPDALAGENRLADKFRLQRFRDHREIMAAIARDELVQLHGSDQLRIADDIGEHDAANAQYYRYARKWVHLFLGDLVCNPAMPKVAPLKVTSVVRSVVYQQRLRRQTANAAPGTSPLTRSSHLTGSTVDITTKDMPDAQKRWLRHKLAELERAGLVRATEEKVGAMCFHIMVSPEYLHRSPDVARH